jgi:calcium/calmodulin-dependent protein kinase I
LFSNQDRKWKLADFGISSAVSALTTAFTREARGTEGYCAPEIFQGNGEFTNKVDIWSMGCILHELVTGQKLFQTDWTVTQYSMLHKPLNLEISEAHETAYRRVITDAIKSMVGLDPISRPTADQLLEKFSHLYEEATKRNPNRIAPKMPAIGNSPGYFL